MTLPGTIESRRIWTRTFAAFGMVLVLLIAGQNPAAAEDGEPCQVWVDQLALHQARQGADADYPQRWIDRAQADLTACEGRHSTFYDDFDTGTDRAPAPRPRQVQSFTHSDAHNPYLSPQHPSGQQGEQAGAPMVTDGVVAAEIVDRPVGENVVTITPTGEGITITGPDGDETRSEAPLWPDHPAKGDAGADPGSQGVGDAVGDGENVVVLNRPATRKSDGEAHVEQWDAWHVTYLELIARGYPFVECETDDAAPEAAQCWVTDPALVPATEPEQSDDPDGEDAGQGAVSAAVAESPEEQWPGRNFGWTDPGPVEAPGSDEDEAVNPLLTTGQNPEDGSDIIVVNVPADTDDPEQRRKNFDLENETLEALDAIDEPYVICFPETTGIDINTGQPHTTPAYCNVRYP